MAKKKSATKKKTAAQKARTKDGFALVCGFCGKRGFKSPQGHAAHKRNCKEAPSRPEVNNGRPTKYSPELIERVHAYIDLCEDKWYPQIQSYKEPEQDGPIEKLDVRQQLHVKVPSIQGLSRFLKVGKNTLYEWGKKYPEFQDALDEVLAEQHERLFNNGLAGTYNPTIAKLGLTSNHGYSDKKGLTHDGGLRIEDIVLGNGESDDEEAD